MTEKTKRRLSLTVTVLVEAVLISMLLWWVLFVNNIAQEMVVEAGAEPDPAALLLRDVDIPAEFETGLTEEQLHTPGDYPATVRYYGRSHDVTIRVRDTIAPAAETRDLTVFATQMPEAADFITEVQDATTVDITYKTGPDMTFEGVQTVVIQLTDLGGNTTEVTAGLTVIFDVTAPEISGVEELRNYLGQEIDYLAGVTVTDDLDENVTLTVDDSAVDLTTPGVYELTYTAEDVCHNVTTVGTTVTVILDTTPPEILGITARSLFAGSSIAYRGGIILRDDYDEAPRLTVDSSAVDLSTPGTYPLIYKAVDAAGNEAVAETTVTVWEKRASYVEESVIYEEVDRVIARIITEDMTVKEQVEAIYDWARYSFWYSGYSEKMDWKQAGYKLMVNGYGDCFSFFGATKLLFERLGIPNIDVRRVKVYSCSTDHYWSMVSIDGGETYYYFDATPYSGSYIEFCLATDAELDWFSYTHNYYFNRDRSILPATPQERPD